MYFKIILFSFLLFALIVNLKAHPHPLNKTGVSDNSATLKNATNLKKTPHTKTNTANKPTTKAPYLKKANNLTTIPTKQNKPTMAVASSSKTIINSQSTSKSNFNAEPSSLTYNNSATNNDSNTNSLNTKLEKNNHSVFFNGFYNPTGFKIRKNNKTLALKETGINLGYHFTLKNLPNINLGVSGSFSMLSSAKYTNNNITYKINNGYTYKANTFMQYNFYNINKFNVFINASIGLVAVNFKYNANQNQPILRTSNNIIENSTTKLNTTRLDSILDGVDNFLTNSISNIACKIKCYDYIISPNIIMLDIEASEDRNTYSEYLLINFDKKHIAILAQYEDTKIIIGQNPLIIDNINFILQKWTDSKKDIFFNVFDKFTVNNNKETQEYLENILEEFYIEILNDDTLFNSVDITGGYTYYDPLWSDDKILDGWNWSDNLSKEELTKYLIENETELYTIFKEESLNRIYYKEIISNTISENIFAMGLNYSISLGVEYALSNNIFLNTSVSFNGDIFAKKYTKDNDFIKKTAISLNQNNALLNLGIVYKF
jgi:hypothetical protein